MTWKKWLKRTVIAVVAYLILQTLWLVGERQWRWSKGNREVALAFAETEATDPDWRWTALNSKRRFPPVEKNGAALIWRIKGLLPGEWVRVDNPKKWEPSPPPLEPNQAYSEDMIAALREDLAAAREAITLARTLRDIPDGNRAIDIKPDYLSTLLPDTQDTRLVATLLRWDTVLAVADGDKTRAADNLLAMLNNSRSFGDEPFLISQLVRIATRVIAARSLEWVLGQTELVEPKLTEFQQAWARDAEEPLLLHCLRGERAALDVLFQNMADGIVGGNDIQHFSFGTYAWWLYRGRIPHERAYIHRYLTAAVDAARLPVVEQPAGISNMPPLPTDDMKYAQLLLPAVEKVAGAHWRSVAESRCVVVGLACERFRLKHARWPETLAEIPKELLENIPLDPFDGQPLRYRALPDGIVIYSVGKDRTDNGGSIARDPNSSPAPTRAFACGTGRTGESRSW